MSQTTKKSKLPYVSKRNTIKAYLFLGPAILVAGAFCWFPAIQSFCQSFFTVNAGGKILGFAGLKNYKALFGDKAFWNSIRNTLVFVLCFVPLNTLMTLTAASMTRRKSKYSFLPEYIFFMPVAVSLSAYSLLIKELFRGKASVINTLFHLHYGWITTKGGAMAALVILGIFLDFGLDYIILLCAFRSSDKSIIEAARLDGAGSTRLFLSIEIPLIRETTLVTIFLALKDALLISAPVIILTEGGPFRSTETLMFYYYTEAFRSGNRAVQNSLSALVLLLAASSMAIYLGRRKK